MRQTAPTLTCAIRGTGLHSKTGLAMRKKSAIYYGRYQRKTNRSKTKRKHWACCSITNMWGNSETVVGAHLLPLNTTPNNVQIALGMVGKLNDVRNVIPLLKTIERAYDTKRLCIILDSNDDETDQKYRIKVLDPTLLREIVYGSVTFQQLEQMPFPLPLGADGTGPFTKCLSFQAQKSYDIAVKKEWLLRTHPRPVPYGSPLDDDRISFALDGTVNTFEDTLDETTFSQSV